MDFKTLWGILKVYVYETHKIAQHIEYLLFQLLMINKYRFVHKMSIILKFIKILLNVFVFVNF